MEEKDLPKGWKMVEFKKACDVLSANGIKIKQKNYLENGKYPVIDQGQNLIGGYYNDKNFLVEDEPPYIVFGDHTKVKKFINFKFIPGADGIKIFKPKDFFNPKLFYYFLFSIKIPDKGYARHFQFLNKSLIPVPSLPEQEQIVSKIEELFSEIDKGVEQMKLAQEQLKVYRQSVLKWAFEGKLTNENVKDGELPKGWEWKAFGDIMDLLTDYHSNGSYEKLKENVELKDEKDYATMIRATNFEKKNFKDFKYISKSAYNFLAKSKLFGGEILIGKIGNAGRIYFMPDLKRPCSLAMNLFLVRVNNETNNKYIHYHLISEKSKREISSYVKGVGNPTIDKKSIRKIAIAYPPLEEQELIVSEIESRLSVCDKLEETIETSLKQAETLRQSILKKAFEGKLI